MLRRKLLLGLAVFLAFQCPSSYAEEKNSRDISNRIRFLRERLERFRSRDESASTREAAASATPEEKSEKLETRKDAKVIILYHEPTGAAKLNEGPGIVIPGRDSPDRDRPSVMPVSEKEGATNSGKNGSVPTLKENLNQPKNPKLTRAEMIQQLREHLANSSNPI